MNEFNPKSHIVDVIKAKFGTKLSSSINMENVYFESFVDCATDTLIHQVEIFLLSNTNKEETKTTTEVTKEFLEFPSSWFQHLKMRFGLKYKTKKHGYIQTHTTNKTVIKTHLCSHMPIDTTKKHVQFLTFEQVRVR